MSLRLIKLTAVHHKTVILLVKGHFIVALVIFLLHFICIPIIPICALALVVIWSLLIKMVLFFLSTILPLYWPIIFMLIVSFTLVTVFAHGEIILVAHHRLIEGVGSGPVGSFLKLVYQLFSLFLIQPI